jgi:PAS domain S-box-containing protein
MTTARIVNSNDRWIDDIVKISEIGYWQFNLKNKEIKWSEQVYKIHNKSLNFKPTIKNIVNFYAQDDIIATKKLIKKNYKNRNNFIFEIKITSVKKEEIYVEVECKFIVNDKETYLVGTLKNITNNTNKAHILVKESKQLEKLIDHAKIAKALISPQGSFLKTNKALSDLLGYSKEELLQIKHQDITYHADLKNSNKFINKIIANKINSFQSEKRYFHKNGSIIYCLNNITVIRKESTLPIELILEIVDITRHKKNHEELSISNKNLNIAVESADFGLWDWNIKTGEVFYNSKWCSMLGYQNHEIKPHFSSFKKVVHPQDKPVIIQKLQNYFDGKTDRYQEQIRLKHKSGKWLNIITSGKITERDKNNKPLRMVGTHIDISEQLQTLNILHDIFDISSSKNLTNHNKIMHILDKAKNYLYMYSFVVVKMQNQTPKIAYNSPENEFNINSDINKLYNLCHQQNKLFTLNHEQKSKLIGKNLVKIKSIISLPVYVNNKNYGIIIFAANNIKENYSKNEIAILKIISQWISEQIRHIIQIEKLKKSEKKLEISVNKLTESNDELDRFAYMASHDLQEPLRRILSLTEIIKTRYQSEFDKKLDQYFNYIYNAAYEMRKLIVDLLEYSRIDKDNQHNYISINPMISIKEVISRFKESLNNIKYNINIENIPEKIYTNHLLFQLLIQNIISNAIKYRNTKKRLQISIYANESNDNFEFKIKDNGVGIEEEYFNLIFEPFKRLESNHYSEGSGIGLAICKKIINKFNGNIWVTSNINQGSVFHFTIPKKNP